MGGKARCSSIGLVAALAFAGLAFAPGNAQAQPGMAPPARPAAGRPRTETHRYGTAIFVADGVVVAVALAGGGGEPLLALPLTGPIIHAFHGRFRAAGGSLLLRTLVPIAGAFAGAEICGALTENDSSGESCMGQAVIGFLSASAFALGVDYLVLARKQVEVEGGPRVQPALTLTPTAGTAGVRVAF